MDEPKVSIIIPVYNGANYLSDAIESALNQTYQNIEVIVVNDGSDDEGKTAAVANKFGREIKYIEKQNGGTASALNAGIHFMSGDYFAWLSHDDVFKPQKIEKQVKAIEQSGNQTVIAFDNYELLNTGTGRVSATRMSQVFDESRLDQSFFSFFLFELHFSSLLISKKILDETGDFREDLCTSQDNDMIFRLLRGRKLVFSDETGSQVRIHSSSGTTLHRGEVNKENRKLYLSMAEQVEAEEAASVFGSAGSFYAKVGGIIKSMGGEAELSSLENLWRTRCKQELSRGTADSDVMDNYFSGRQIFIYGAGQYGVRLKYELNSRGIFPLAFIDRSAGRYGGIVDGIPCLSPDEFRRSEYSHSARGLLINSIKAFADAEETIAGLGIRPCIRKDEADALLLRMIPTHIPQ